MKLIIAMTLAAVAAGVSLSADAKFDPDAAAKKLAPFFDEQTVAVARFDLAAIEIDEWFKLFAKWTGMPGANLDEPRTRIRDLQAQLRKAGAWEAYIVFSLADIPEPGPFILVPRNDATDPAAVSLAFRKMGPFATQELHGAVAIGMKSTIDRLKSLSPSARPDLPKAFAALPNAVAQIALVPGKDQRRIVEEMLPNLPAQLGGGPGTILTRGIQWAVCGVESKPSAQVSVVIQCKDASAATAIQEIAGKAVMFAARAGKEMDLNMAALAPILTPKVSGDKLTLSVGEDDEAVVKLIAKTVEKTRAASGRVTSMNNLKQLALAMHNYADAYRGQMVSHAIYSKDNKTPLLSWRVAILPFIDQVELYKKFKLDEPWDSPNNKALIPFMPKVYLDPLAPPSKAPGLTHYQLFVGPKAAWERSANGPGLPRSFPDGTSNTILIAEAADPVIWTKPDDIDFDPDKPLPKLGVDPKLGFLAAMADGSVRVIGPKVSEKTRKAAITAAGNETLGPDW